MKKESKNLIIIKSRRISEAKYADRYYQTIKKNILAIKKAFEKTLKKDLDSIVRSYQKEKNIFLDSWSDDSDDAFKKFEQEIKFGVITEEELFLSIEETFKSVSHAQRRAFESAFKIAIENLPETSFEKIMKSEKIRRQLYYPERVGIEKWIKDEIKSRQLENAALVKDITEQTTKKITTTVFNEIKSGKRAEAIESEIKKVLKSSDKRAKLVARDQTLKFMGEVEKAKQNHAGVGSYRWLTMMDERVRKSHRRRNGKIYTWKKGPPDGGHPKSEILCRCEAVGVIDIDAIIEDS